MTDLSNTGGASHQLGHTTDFTEPGAEKGLSDQIVFGYKVLFPIQGNYVRATESIVR